MNDVFSTIYGCITADRPCNETKIYKVIEIIPNNNDAIEKFFDDLESATNYCKNEIASNKLVKCNIYEYNVSFVRRMTQKSRTVTIETATEPYWE